MDDPETFVEGGFPVEPYSEVIPGLFQASSWLSPEELFDTGFDAVFDLCGRDRSDGKIDDRYVSHLIDDVPYLEDPQAIHDLGERVAELVSSGKTVAVNCLSGLNRSGMLVARALIALGHSPTEAVELVRAARGPRALSNKQFMRFLIVDCTPRRLSSLRSGEPSEAEEASGPERLALRTVAR